MVGGAEVEKGLRNAALTSRGHCQDPVRKHMAGAGARTARSQPLERMARSKTTKQNNEQQKRETNEQYLTVEVEQGVKEDVER